MDEECTTFITTTTWENTSEINNHNINNSEILEPRLPTKYLEVMWNSNRSVYITFGILTCIIGSLGLIGNILTVTVLFKGSMRSFPVNRLLLTLAIWDILVIISFLFSYNSLKAASQIIWLDEEYEFLWLRSFPYIYPLLLTCTIIEF